MLINVKKFTLYKLREKSENRTPLHIDWTLNWILCLSAGGGCHYISVIKKIIFKKNNLGSDKETIFVRLIKSEHKNLIFIWNSVFPKANYYYRTHLDVKYLKKSLLDDVTNLQELSHNLINKTFIQMKVIVRAKTMCNCIYSQQFHSNSINSIWI